jgi:hypothetical protein
VRLVQPYRFMSNLRKVADEADASTAPGLLKGQKAYPPNGETLGEHPRVPHEGDKTRKQHELVEHLMSMAGDDNDVKIHGADHVLAGLLQKWGQDQKAKRLWKELYQCDDPVS